MMSKKCPACGETKRANEFHIGKRTRDGLYYICKSCSSQYQSKYRAEHPEGPRLYNKKYYASLRLKVLSHYGNKCAFCGDHNPNHLSVDHINNDGAEHRRGMGSRGGASMYLWLVKNNYPDGFQLLCHTHNMEKSIYGTMTHDEFGD